MSRVCEICGKRTRVGKNVSRRGLPKKKGGIGIKTTAKTKRRFFPNLQKVRAIVNGGVKRIRVCTQCLRSGKVIKAPRHSKIYQPQEASEANA